MKKDLWSYWAGRYDRLLVQRLVLGPSRRLVLDCLDRFCPGARRILDVGCGIGQLAFEISQKRPDAGIVACDPTPEMIDVARAKFPAPNITHICGDVLAVPVDAPFDAVVSTNALPYVTDQPAFMRAVHRLLKPGGDCFILHANSNTVYDRIILGLVKLTVPPAAYLSVQELETLMWNADLDVIGKEPIVKPVFVPTVTLVHGRRPSQ